LCEVQARDLCIPVHFRPAWYHSLTRDSEGERLRNALQKDFDSNSQILTPLLIANLTILVAPAMDLLNIRETLFGDKPNILGVWAGNFVILSLISCALRCGTSMGSKSWFRLPMMPN
jgi:hypothetical protein